MTELEIFMLQAQSSQATGAYQIAMAFSVWVAFRVASVVGKEHESNLVAKVAGSVFGLGTLFFFNMTYAFYSFNMASTGHRLAQLQASGGEISAVAADYVIQSGASTTAPAMSLLPSDPIIALLELSILTLILVPIWMPKK
tara:strand:+ start:122 stop:544 length:423 start_codon:yes stop_codon:yes gene_type:complete